MLREIFERNPNIIINNDIDGFLSGMILQHYLDCVIVGFTNSRDKVWVTPEVQSIFDPVYIDMYVNNPDVICIDQHVVANTNESFERILCYGTKLNPNLQLNRRTLNQDFSLKYPFGTVHYLMHLLGEEGIDVEFRNLREQVHVEIDGRDYITYPGQVLMRADDALFNSFIDEYRENADCWWNDLNTSESVNRIIEYKDSCYPDRKTSYENHIGRFFQALGCSPNNYINNVKRGYGVTNDSDGALPFITVEENLGVESSVRPEVREYVRVISSVMGIEMNIPDRYILHIGDRHIGNQNDLQNVNQEDLFSYAFVYGPRNENCFSYTINMQ